jgi:hypothetical protein
MSVPSDPCARVNDVGSALALFILAGALLKRTDVRAMSSADHEPNLARFEHHATHTHEEC